MTTYHRVRPEDLSPPVATTATTAAVDGRAFAAQAFVSSHLLPTRTAARLTGRFFAKAAREARTREE